MKHEKILVTGSAGFIGFHVARGLLRDGKRVTGLDNLNDYYDVNLKRARLAQLIGRRGFRFVLADLADRTRMEQLFEEPFDCVIHLAAQAGVRYSLTNPHAYVQSNVVGFTNVLEGCRHAHVKHLVFASSSSVYGANKQMPFSVRDSVDHPVSLYAATKKTDELMAHVYAHLYDLPSTGLRFFTVYGPWGRPEMALFIFTKAILEGRPIDVYNYGHMRRDLTYIDDIVEGIVRVSDKVPEPDPDWDGELLGPGRSSAPYRIYNIGNSDPVDLEELITILEEKLGRKAKRRLLPLQQGDVPATFADVADLEQDIGFKPKTSLREGIGRFVNWYLDYYGPEELVGAHAESICKQLDAIDGRNAGSRSRYAHRSERVIKRIAECFLLAPIAFGLALSSAAAARAPVELKRQGDRIDVLIGGRPFTTYYFGAADAKPYLFPLRSAEGTIVTRSFPMAGDIAGEDHGEPHQRAMHFAHGDINGFDFWGEAAFPRWSRHPVSTFGRTVFRKPDQMRAGPESGELRAEFDLVTSEGQVIAGETQAYSFKGDERSRIIDCEFTMLGNHGAVRMGDTKEGTFAIRVVKALDSPPGRMINSNGAAGEKAVWGKRADWVDFDGNVAGEEVEVGIAVFDNPGNLRHPTYWHARHYGLLAANPFGLKEFTHDRHQDGSYTIAVGGSLTLRFIHEGNFKQARVADAYRKYAAGQ